MPTYDHECEACGHKFEKFQSITAAPIRKCPKCAKRKVRRLIGMGAGVIFKGSGFYQTDYRSESYKKAAAKDQGGAGGEAKKASGDGEAKKPSGETGTAAKATETSKGSSKQD